MRAESHNKITAAIGHHTKHMWKLVVEPEISGVGSLRVNRKVTGKPLRCAVLGDLVDRAEKYSLIVEPEKALHINVIEVCQQAHLPIADLDNREVVTALVRDNRSQPLAVWRYFHMRIAGQPEEFTDRDIGGGLVATAGCRSLSLNRQRRANDKPGECEEGQTGEEFHRVMGVT
ncbi:MAG TPA: hypothetical protein PLD41_03445 [Casimicrobium huifangae]|nr:hypothetical protein [Casimicrobium huifangae]